MPFLETPEYFQLIKFFNEKVLKVLEKYVVEIIKWGEVTFEEEKIGKKALTPQEVADKILSRIVVLSEQANVLSVDYNKELISKIDELQKDNLAVNKYNIEKIFSSIYYTMDQTDKYKILELIIDKTGYKFFKNKELSKYKDEVIEHRNNLAHKKIEFAPCYKFLIYYNKLIELKIQVCECKNHSDEHKYSLTKCEEIRQSLFDFWGEFQTMFNAIT